MVQRPRLMFAALFMAFGVGIAWLFDRLRVGIAGPGPGARVVEAFTWPALGLGMLLLCAGALSVLTRPDEFVFPLLLAVGLLVASFAHWRRLPKAVAYAALSSVVALGTWRTVGGLAELIARI